VIRESTLRFALTLVEAAGSLLLLAILLMRRIAGRIPLFALYIGYGAVWGSVAVALLLYAPHYCVPVWIAGQALDTTLFLLVLCEIAQSLIALNPDTKRSRLTVPAALFVPAVALIWSIARWSNLPDHGSLLWYLDLRTMQIAPIISVAGVLALLWWTTLRSLHWPEREIRLVTGMGLWSLISLAVLILHAHGAYGPDFYWMDLLTPICCVFVLLYWMAHFLHEPPNTLPRRSEREISLAVGAAHR
jgi:hypothetical protein